MTKTVEIALWDDVHRLAGQKVRASQTVRFSYKGKQYELELTEEHADKFDVEMSPWVKAAHSPDSGAGLSKDYLGHGPATPPGSTSRRDYWKGLRNWADKLDKRDRKNPDRMAYLNSSGQFYYPSWLVAEYETWLLEQAAGQET